MPLSYEVIATAKAWGVPPWVLAGEPDTEAVRSRWFFRQRIFSSMGI